jgi:DNA-directed RNA polymerase subunit omega
VEKLGFVDSKFRLCILAAKRAKQLIKGSKKKIDIKAENPLTIAIEEINRGLIDYEILHENLDDFFNDSLQPEEIKAIPHFRDQDNDDKDDDDDDDDDDVSEETDEEIEYDENDDESDDKELYDEEEDQD